MPKFMWLEEDYGSIRCIETFPFGFNLHKCMKLVFTHSYFRSDPWNIPVF